MNDAMISRMCALGERIFEANGELPVLDRLAHKDQWKAWESWRRRNGLSVSVMEYRDKWTVLEWYPPFDLADLEAKYSKKGRA